MCICLSLKKRRRGKSFNEHINPFPFLSRFVWRNYISLSFGRSTMVRIGATHNMSIWCFVVLHSITVEQWRNQEYCGLAKKTKLLPFVLHLKKQTLKTFINVKWNPLNGITVNVIFHSLWLDGGFLINITVYYLKNILVLLSYV